MSWLSGLAGKAEEMLNKVDQVAGQALHNPDGTPQTTTAIYPGSDKIKFSEQSEVSSHNLINSSSVPSDLNKLNTENTYLSQMSKSMYTPRSVTPTATNTARSVTPTATNSVPNKTNTTSTGPSKKKKSDDELFEFLNSPETTEKRKSAPVLNVNKITNGKHSRNSSTSSVASSNRSKDVGSVFTPVSVQGEPELNTETNALPPPASEAPAPVVTMVSEVAETQQAAPPSDNMDMDHHKTSSLELENQLLKNEVTSLNQEMGSIIKRAKLAEEDLSRLKKKRTGEQDQLSRCEQITRELRAREGDLQEALSAKDSQIGVLRVRYEEVSRDLNEKNDTLRKLEAENERILSDHTSSSGVQNQALDTLKDKLTEAQTSLAREKDAYSKAQVEAHERQNKLESDLQEMGAALNTAQRKLDDEKVRYTEVHRKIESAKAQAESAKTELQEYKDKATRILQSKDRLISSLKEGGIGSGAESAIHQAELEELRQERDMLKEELQKCNMSRDSIKTELQDLEVQLQLETESLRDELRSVEDQYSTCKHAKEDAEQEIHRQKQELRYAHEELLKQKTAMQSRISDREGEINKLRNQLTNKNVNSTSQQELESRLHSLTESLIQKQTVLEALSTEKNSLVLQLERLEKQNVELETATVRANTMSVHMHDDDETRYRHRMPGFLRETMTDGEVTRKMKRAASTVDKLSIKLGVFLRRYPIARVFVVLYMVLLHLWVMIVLLTYQPEIHGTDSHPMPPGAQPNN